MTRISKDAHDKAVKSLNDSGYRYRMSGKNGKKIVVMLGIGVTVACVVAILLLAKLGDYVDLLYTNEWLQLGTLLVITIPTGIFWLIRRSINK